MNDTQRADQSGSFKRTGFGSLSRIILGTMLMAFLPFGLAAFNITLGGSPMPSEKEVFQQLAPILNALKGNQALGIPPKDYRIKTVVIDAGHGGHDPGCLGKGSKEKHIALHIALELAKSIRMAYPEVDVILTRDSDVFVPLHERAQIANRSGADLFISIHCNYFSSRESTNGTETYVMGLHTAEYNLDVAKRENSVILLEDDYEANYDFDPNSAEGHIMLSMFQNVFLEQSILFAEQVERQFDESNNRKSRGVKQAGFVVLKETAMPSVLIETGFLSNRAEEGYLSSKAGQKQVAEAIRIAFGEYKLRIEGPVQLVSSSEPARNEEDLSLGEEPFNTSPTRVSYCVQLAASPTPLNINGDQWRELQFQVETLKEEGLYRYQARNFPSLEDAKSAQKYFRNKGFNDAFIVAYRNGKKVSLSELH